MPHNQFISQIDEIVEEYHLLKHPFYQAWNEGKLTIESLQDYAKQYYHHVEAFPTYLSAVHTQTEDMNTRKYLLQNLIDEEAGSPNHPDLWLQFSSALGLSHKDVLETEKWYKTTTLIDTFKRICSEYGTATGIAALYAYESQIPEIAETKIKGLEEYYGLNSAMATNYFNVHIEADKEHAAVEKQLLESYLTDGNIAKVKSEVEVVLKALWNLLSEVCEQHQIH
jgi:pyrroloquinoline-quinone synthase